MPRFNKLSVSVTLKQDAKKGQVVSTKGFLANTGTADQHPDGILMYDGKTGDEIAIITVGLHDCKQDGTLEKGDKVKAVAGELVKATQVTESFGTVSAVNSLNSVELMIK